MIYFLTVPDDHTVLHILLRGQFSILDVADDCVECYFNMKYNNDRCLLKGETKMILLSLDDNFLAEVCVELECDF